jgi:hypothetical protein
MATLLRATGPRSVQVANGARLCDARLLVAPKQCEGGKFDPQQWSNITTHQNNPNADRRKNFYGN